MLSQSNLFPFQVPLAWIKIMCLLLLHAPTLYKFIYVIVCLFVWVSGISNFVGYIKPNLFFKQRNSSISNNSV